MKVIRYRCFLLLVFFFSITINVFSQDWPQYLGPARNAQSTEKGILRTWPQKGPEVLWRVNVGLGFGGPVIKDGKVYLLDRDDKVGDKMRCFDLKTGKELWSFGYDAPGSVQFPGSRSVPAIDGNRIYSCGHNGDLYCIDINTHKPLWNKNVWTDFGGERLPTWAITQCPLIYGDLVIIASQAPKAGVVAYDKMTGTVKWTTPNLGNVGYVSPNIVKIGNENHVVMMSAAAGRGANASGGKTVGIDPLTGKILWEYTGWQCIIPVPPATDAGGNRILLIGGYNAGAAMIRVDKKGSEYAVTELFKTPDFGDHTKPAILYNGHFYAQYSTNERKDGLVCMSMDGQIKWKTGRSPLFDKGGMILVDGLILATDGATKLYLIQPDPSGFKPIASADVLSAGVPGDSDNSTETRFGGASRNWAPLSLSNGLLVIRDQRQLVCVKVGK